MVEPIRVLLADDHQIVREGLRMILESNPTFQVVAEAADGQAAVMLAASESPDVILMDLRMPGLDGLGAIQQIHQAQPEIAIVILTTYNEDDLMIRGLRAGARGYLLKDTSRTALFNTMLAAVRGETLLPPEIMDRMLNQIDPPRHNLPSKQITLTDRESEVLRLVAQGLRSKEIAQQLYITERTVKAHLDNMYTKFGVASRAAAVAMAIQMGLLQGN
jgi:NarL family two-component system response regulator YdfI